MQENINNFYAYLFQNGGRPIISAKTMPRRIECNRPSLEWQGRINQKPWGSGYEGETIYSIKELELIELIRSLDGFEVHYSKDNEHDEKLLERGQLWYGDVAKGKDLDKKDRDKNICYLWGAFNNKKSVDNPFPAVAIAKGYALSKDGLWRPHVWLLQRNVRSIHIVEATKKRVAYFGYIMTEREAMEFCDKTIWNGANNL